MKVGDLVRAGHWHDSAIGVVVSIRPTGICKVFLLCKPEYRFDQLIRDLEVICK